MVIKKVYSIFWLSILPIIFISYLMNKFSGTMDINIHDTYYVIENLHFTISLCIIYFAIGTIYFILYQLKIKLNRTLTIIHMLAMTVGLLISIILYSTFVSQSNADTLHFTKNISRINLVLGISIVFFALAQVIFILNICIGVFHKK